MAKWRDLLESQQPKISIAKVGLRDSLLYQDEETNRIIVALDPDILQVYREIELLSKWGLEIPEIAIELSQKESELKKHYHNLKVCCFSFFIF
ncbi:unnamed protein product [Trichobilharzia regenti]|nr:unnamed protein product [Trichobilharzia regenti]